MKNETKELKLVEIKKDTELMFKQVNSLSIKTAEDMVNATRVLSNLTGRAKRVEEIRLFFTKPLNDQLHKINDEFRDVSSLLKGLNVIVKDKMTVYRNLENEKLEKARQKAEEKRRKEFKKEQAKLKAKAEKEAEKERQRLAKLELSKKDEKAELKRINDEQKEKENEADREEFNFDDSDFKQTKSVHTNNGSIRVRTSWAFDIVNENDVPRHYLVVDQVAIRKAVNSGVRDINGVKIYEKEIISAIL